MGTGEVAVPERRVCRRAVGESDAGLRETGAPRVSSGRAAYFALLPRSCGTITVALRDAVLPEASLAVAVIL